LQISNLTHLDNEKILIRIDTMQKDRFAQTRNFTAHLPPK
jgi:hypothetical protein